MNSLDATTDSLEERALAAVREQFGVEARHLAAAPGRINLIGEHVDYEGGLVLPVAIDRRIVVAAAPSAVPVLRIWSEKDATVREFDLNEALQKNGNDWTNYAIGVIAQFNRLGVHVGGFDAAIVSDLPVGAGLSSSAALEVAVCLVLESLTGHELSPRKRAKLAQAAEHEFAGVPCGIMDQMAVTHAKEGHALLLDCRSLEVDHVPIPPGLSILVLNTLTKHSLGDGEYAKRRADCRMACDILGIANLCDADLVKLEENRDKLGDIFYRRARHVTTEIRRVSQFVDALSQEDFKSAGWLLCASHASLRDDFEVSCRELDVMQKIASRREDILGARMTGGGFGGCVVALCENPSPALADVILAEYEKRTGRKGEAYLARAAGGAALLDAPAVPS